jgi:hypothetical protein
MALLSGEIDIDGPVIDVAVGVSLERERVLLSNRLKVPTPQYLRVLVDTGSNLTGFMPSVFQKLGIQPFGVIPVRTTSTEPDQPHECDQYDVSLTLGVGKQAPMAFHSVYAIACRDFTRRDRYHGIIGRDVLARCNFFYYGPDRRFEFGF